MKGDRMSKPLQDLFGFTELENRRIEARAAAIGLCMRVKDVLEEKGWSVADAEIRLDMHEGSLAELLEKEEQAPVGDLLFVLREFGIDFL